MTITRYRPKVSSGVSIGPEQIKYGKTVYYVKNDLTSRYFRIGQFEYFFLSRFNGNRTLEEIRSEFEAARSLVVSDHEIEQFLASLSSRGLIEDHSRVVVADDDQVGGLKVLQVTRRRFEVYLHLLDPDRMLDWSASYFSWFCRMPTFICLSVVNLWLMLGFGLQIDLLFSHAKAVWASTQSGDAWSILIVLYSCGFVFTIIHEAGHCVVCKYYGGRVNDVGIMFRYLMVMAYSRLDEIVLFESRWHRVHVLLGGILSNFLIQPILAVIWLLSNPIGSTRVLVSILFLISVMAVIFNLIPFVKMDGYFVLCQVLRCPDLREDSYRYLRESARILFTDSGSRSELSGRYVVIYLMYGVASIAVTICLIVFGVFRWLGILAFYLGSWYGAVLVLSILSLLWFYDEVAGWVLRKRSS